MLFTRCCHKFNNTGTSFRLKWLKLNSTHEAFKIIKQSNLSKIKWALKAAISPGRSYNLADSDAQVVRLVRLSSACNLCRPSRWEWDERGAERAVPRVTGHHPQFPQKHSCRGNHCRWCRWPSWRRWSLAGTLSSAWSKQDNQSCV